jgi:hypothetical protein
MDISIVDDKGKREDHHFSGNLLYRAPREVLITGGHDLKPKIVEIGSNHDLYWMSIKDPGPDTAWWGRYKYLGADCVKPIPVRPDRVLEVLGISEISENFVGLPVPVMRFNHDRDEYMLTWIAPTPDHWWAMKEVWYDRQTKRPTHVMLFDADGRVELSAWLSKQQPVEIPNTPREQWPTIATDFRLYFPPEAQAAGPAGGEDRGSRLHLVLDDVRLNRKNVPNDVTFRFSPERAEVSKVIQLDEACGP